VLLALVEQVFSLYREKYFANSLESWTLRCIIEIIKVISGAVNKSVCGTSQEGPFDVICEALEVVRTGNAAPVFYKLGASTSYKTHLHDVTTGNNGAGIGPGYKATADWDYTTGWGSVNGTSALAYFKANP
jgi:hypothetical protein